MSDEPDDATVERVLAILRNKAKRSEQAREIAVLIKGVPEEFDEVWTHETRHEVREVEAYGLVIGLDAGDRATRVAFPYGAYVFTEDGSDG